MALVKAPNEPFQDKEAFKAVGSVIEYEKDKDDKEKLETNSNIVKNKIKSKTK